MTKLVGIDATGETAETLPSLRIAPDGSNLPALVLAEPCVELCGADYYLPGPKRPIVVLVLRDHEWERAHGDVRAVVRTLTRAEAIALARGLEHAIKS